TIWANSFPPSVCTPSASQNVVPAGRCRVSAATSSTPGCTTTAPPGGLAGPGSTRSHTLIGRSARSGAGPPAVHDTSPVTATTPASTAAKRPGRGREDGRTGTTASRSTGEAQQRGERGVTAGAADAEQGGGGYTRAEACGIPAERRIGLAAMRRPVQAGGQREDGRVAR